MLRGLIVVALAVFICGLPQMSKAGQEGDKAKGGSGYAEGGPSSTASTNTVSCAVELRCRQTWTVQGANNGKWVAVPPNGGGGDNEQCRLYGSVCSIYSWRTTHPVGWTPEEDGKSTTEWIECGIRYIIDGASELGVELKDADLEGLQYEESWIPE